MGGDLRNELAYVRRVVNRATMLIVGAAERIE